MNTDLPHPISCYLRTLGQPLKEFAYFGLDQHQRVNQSGGSLGLFGFDPIDYGRTLVSQFDVFEGLLPSGEEPVIIFNTQIVPDQFFDLHLFTEQSDQWVVFLDNSEQAKSLQADQQVRLDEDYSEEKRRLLDR